MTTQTITTIPLNQLIPSSQNVRRTGRNDAIDELVASIRTHGLRQGLNVLPTEDGHYEVVAGGRRLRALKQLVKDKHLPKDFPVPCHVLTAEQDAGEISLAENVVRLAMHPADQFDAFHALRQKGHSTEEIAQRFGVDAALVERRLTLASVAPKLFAAYRKGDMTLECLMAFTLNADHGAQMRVWGERKRMHLSPPTIRRALTENTIPATHRLARFVGTDAYTAAGGAVMRDLFDMQNEGFLTDSALLMQLAADKLTAAEAEVRAEGWKWVRSELETDHSIRYGRVYSVRAAVTDEDTDEQGEEYEESETYGDGDDECYEEDAAPDEDDGTPPVYAPEDMAVAGALLRITHDGSLDILRGLLHPDDRKQEERQGPSKAVKPDAAKGEYAATIVEDLTAHKTAAMRLELSRDNAMALAVTVHAMTLQLLYPYTGTTSCMKLRVERVELTGRVKAQEDCPAHAALQQQKEHWVGLLPENTADLFGWCIEADAMTLFNLLAFCTAMSVTAVRERQVKGNPFHLRHAEQLAQALKLDMAQHWQGTADGFYGNVPKAALVHAVSEASAPMAVSVSNLKKQEAARSVAKAMAGTGWLPTPLRSVESATVEGGQDEARIDISQAIAA